MESGSLRIIVLESTIDAYKGLVSAQEKRIEMLEKSHAFEIENYYTENTEL